MKKTNLAGLILVIIIVIVTLMLLIILQGDEENPLSGLEYTNEEYGY